jgi:hypothetical protein
MRTILAALLLSPACLLAQSPYGSLVGRVVDRQSANVAGAVVRALNLNTQVTTTASSNADGNYLLTTLTPGAYRVEIEKAGFRRFTREPVEVSAGERLTLDVALEIGAVTESITVVSEAPLLESTTASVGQVVDHRTVTDLPSPSSSVIFQIAMAPGIAPLSSPSGNWSPDTEGNTSSFAVSGAGSGSNSVMMDGNPMDNRGSITFHAIPEMVEEVRVQTTAFDASIGRAVGAQVNIVMKSGTNRLHSDFVYGYLGRTLTAMDAFARAFVENPATGPITEDKKRTAWPGAYMRRYRGSASGPVYIPRLYDGRNRTFWTFGFETLSSQNSATGVATVPTDEERNGDFSRLLAVGAQYQLYDPATIAPAGSGRYSRQPLPGNLIPASRIDPGARLILGYYPIANMAGSVDGERNFAYPDNSPQAYDSEMARIDHVLSARQRFFISGTRKHHTHNYNPFRNGAYASLMNRTQYSLTMSDSFTLRPDLIAEVRYGMTRWRDERYSHTRGFDLSTLGLPQSLVSLVDSRFTTLPVVKITDYATIGGGAKAGAATTYSPWTSHDLSANATHIRGEHAVRFGGQFRVMQENVTNLGNVSPNYTFGETWTRGPLDNSPVAPIGGGLASFLLGLPTAGTIDRKDSSAATSKYVGLYAQDDWKITRRLTLNLGIRWESEFPTTERYNRTVSTFDALAANPVEAAARANYAKSPIPQIAAADFRTPGGLVYAGLNGASRSLWRMDRNNVAPRIGLAWLVGGRTVVRAGYGIFYDRLGVDRIGVYQPGYTQATAMTPSLDNGQTFRSTLRNPFPDGVVEPAGSSRGLATYVGNAISAYRPDLKNPYMQRWSFGVQRALRGRWAVDANYIGSRGVGLFYSSALNPVPAQYLSTSPVRDSTAINLLTANVPSPFYGIADFAGSSMVGTTVARSQLLRPFPQFGNVTVTSNDGYSWYHGLQVRLVRRMSRGFMTSVSYTWSKAMDATARLNESDTTPYRSIATIDRPQNLSVSAIYDLPFGPKRRWLAGSRWLGHAVGGWSVQGLYIAQSGAPIAFGNVLHVGRIEDVVLPDGERNPAHWFNTDAFERASGRQLANNIRTFPLRLSGLRTGGMNCLNASLFKSFQFGERLKMQLRAEATNAVNHTMYLDPPNTSPTSTTFGTITSLGSNNQPRRVTLGAKLSW